MCTISTDMEEPMTLAQLYEEQMKALEAADITIYRNISRFPFYEVDAICPVFIFGFQTKGTARFRYDMKEVTAEKNTVVCLMPNHVLQMIETSPDYEVTMVVLSPKMFQDMHYHSFSHDSTKFNHMPFFPVNDAQAEDVLRMTNFMEAISKRSEKELPHRHNMLLAALAIGYEFLNMYRKEQDRQWHENRSASLFSQFCDLVVEHYRESREVAFYAKLLNLTPKYFSKVISQATNGCMPSDWIEQYVTAQAKLLIQSNPNMTIQEISYNLGFPEQASFCRFFKRVTGMTAKQYLRSLNIPIYRRKR